MRRRVLVLTATVASLLALTCGSVMATLLPGNLDQKQETVSQDGGNQPMVGPGQTYGREAQTFTAGVSGSLVRVAVDVSPSVVVTQSVAQPKVAGSIQVAIYSTNAGGNPDASLASVTATLNEGWNNIIFGTPTNVTKLTKYAIVVTPQAGFDNQWYGDCSGETDNYAGGQAMIDNNGDWVAVSSVTGCVRDFAFRTYVAGKGTPPPTNTGGSGESRDSGSPMLLFAGIAAGAAFLTIVSTRQLAILRR